MRSEIFQGQVDSEVVHLVLTECDWRAESAIDRLISILDVKPKLNNLAVIAHNVLFCGNIEDVPVSADNTTTSIDNSRVDYSNIAESDASVFHSEYQQSNTPSVETNIAVASTEDPVHVSRADHSTIAGNDAPAFQNYSAISASEIDDAVASVPTEYSPDSLQQEYTEFIYSGLLASSIATTSEQTLDSNENLFKSKEKNVTSVEKTENNMTIRDELYNFFTPPIKPEPAQDRVVPVQGCCHSDSGAFEHVSSTWSEECIGDTYSNLECMKPTHSHSEGLGDLSLTSMEFHECEELESKMFKKDDSNTLPMNEVRELDTAVRNDSEPVNSDKQLLKLEMPPPLQHVLEILTQSTQGETESSAPEASEQRTSNHESEHHEDEVSKTNTDSWKDIIIPEKILEEVKKNQKTCALSPSAPIFVPRFSPELISMQSSSGGGQSHQLTAQEYCVPYSPQTGFPVTSMAAPSFLIPKWSTSSPSGSKSPRSKSPSSSPSSNTCSMSPVVTSSRPPFHRQQTKPIDKVQDKVHSAQADVVTSRKIVSVPNSNRPIYSKVFQKKSYSRPQVSRLPPKPVALEQGDRQVTPIERIRDFVKEGTKVMVILRGLPGSGKSTLAHDVKFGGIVLSSDDYYMKGNIYDFDILKRPEAHKWNRYRAKKSLETGTSPVVIDNTNTVSWEMRPYVSLGLQFGYKIEILEPSTPWKFKPKELARRNRHAVPLEAIEQMLERYEKNVTVESVALLLKNVNKMKDSNSRDAKENEIQDNAPQNDSKKSIKVVKSRKIKEHKSAEKNKFEASFRNPFEALQSNSDSSSTSSDTISEDNELNEDKAVKKCQDEKSGDSGKSLEMEKEICSENKADMKVGQIEDFEELSKLCSMDSDEKLFEPSNKGNAENLEFVSPEIVLSHEQKVNVDTSEVLAADVKSMIEGILDENLSSVTEENFENKLEEFYALFRLMALDEKQTVAAEKMAQNRIHALLRSNGSQKFDKTWDMETKSVHPPDTFSSNVEVSEDMTFELDYWGSSDEKHQNLYTDADAFWQCEKANASSPSTGAGNNNGTKIKITECSTPSDEIWSPYVERREEEIMIPSNVQSYTNEAITFDDPKPRRERKRSGNTKRRIMPSGVTCDEKSSQNVCRTVETEPITELTVDEMNVNIELHVSSNPEQKVYEPVHQDAIVSIPSILMDTPQEMKQDSIPSMLMDTPQEINRDSITSVPMDTPQEINRDSITSVPIDTPQEINSGSISSALMDMPQEINRGSITSTLSYRPLLSIDHQKEFESGEIEDSCINQNIGTEISASPPQVTKKSKSNKRKIAARFQGPFLEEKVKEKCITENWNFPAFENPEQFVVNDLNVEKRSCVYVDQETSVTPSDLKILDAVNKHNRMTSCSDGGMKIIASYGRELSKDLSNGLKQSRNGMEHKILIDKSTMTTELQEADEEFLVNSFPSIAEDELRDILNQCGGNVSWAVDLLLDWRYNLQLTPEEKMKFVEAMCKVQKVPVTPTTPGSLLENPFGTSNMKSPGCLFDLCVSIVEKQNLSTRKELEGQLIERGKQILSEIEAVSTLKFQRNRSREDRSIPSSPEQARVIEESDSGSDVSIEEEVQKSDSSTKSYDVIPDESGLGSTAAGGDDSVSRTDAFMTDMFQLRLPENLALTLVQIFGPVGSDVGINVEVSLDFQTAHGLHQCWRSSLVERTAKKKQMEDDEALARQLQHEENGFVQKTDRSQIATNTVRQGFPAVIDVSRRPPRLQPLSLKSIMAEELAKQSDQEAMKKAIEATGEHVALATMLKRKKLYEQFPGIDESLLNELFQTNGFSLEKTVDAIEGFLGDDIQPPRNVMTDDAADAYERQLVEAAKQQSLQEMVDSYLYTPTSRKDYQISQHPNYEDYRGEANIHHRLRHECFQKAQQAYQRNMRDVAFFYSQQGHLHTQKIKEANLRASEMILTTRNVQNKTTLDMHGLHVDEAISALDGILPRMEREFQERPDKTRQHLIIITGRGSHSRGGIAKLRPAVLKYLQKKNYNFTEEQKGAFKVLLKYRTV
ncbi:hypothetical protein ScPMuIL_011307 [Solemya velum]